MAQLQLNDFSGSMNQNSAPDLLVYNQSPLMVNVSQDQSGSIASRLGSTRLYTSATNSRNRGLFTYEKADGTHTVIGLHGGNLYKYNGTSETLIASNVYGSTSEASFVNYLNKVYMATGNSGEYLKCWDGNTLTTVNGNLDVAYLTVSSGRLFALGGTSYPRRLNYTDAGSEILTLYATVDASSTGTTLVTTGNVFAPEHVGKALFNVTDKKGARILAYTNETTVVLDTTVDDTWDGDAIRIGDNWVDLDEPGTAMRAFGETSPVLAFDRQSMYVFDPGVSSTTASLRKKVGFGCSSHRSLQVNQGNGCWLGRNGMFRYAEGDAYPTKISRLLDNRVTGEGVFNLITGAGFTTSAAGTIGDKYYLSIGDLSANIQGEDLNDVMIIYDIKLNTCSLRTYESIGVATDFATWIDANGDEQLLVGSKDSGKIYKLDVANTYTDDGTAITSIYRTKHMEFSYVTKTKSVGSELEKQIESGHIKVYTSNPLTINKSVDGLIAYSLWSETGTTPAGLNWHREHLAPFNEPIFKSLSTEFRGTGKWIIFYFGLGIQPLNSTGLREI